MKASVCNAERFLSAMISLLYMSIKVLITSIPSGTIGVLKLILKIVEELRANPIFKFAESRAATQLGFEITIFCCASSLAVVKEGFSSRVP